MANLTKLGSPLGWGIRITDSNGNPTPEFQRHWEELRGTAAGIPQLSTPAQVSAVLDVFGTTRGSLLFRGAGGWQLLTPGTSGQFLETGGPGADPLWGTVSAPNIQTLLDSIGATQGNVLYRSATGWAVLAPGTSGQVLTSGGAGANPSWAAGGGGGGGGVGTLTTCALTGTQAVAANTWTAVVWPTPLEDPASSWSAGHPTRFALPGGKTRCRVNFFVAFNNAPITFTALALVKNDAATSPPTNANMLRTQYTQTEFQGFTTLHTDWLTLTAGDYVETDVFTSNAGTLQFDPAVAGGAPTRVQLEWA